MAKEKKSHKEGKKANSKAAASYKAGFRRYFNKLKKVKKHCERQDDKRASIWLADAKKMLAMDYVRGSDKVKELHERIYS